MKQKHLYASLVLITLSACGHRVHTGAPGKDGLSIQGEKGDTIQGPQGLPGTPGADGQGCEVTQVPVSAQAPNGGALIACPTSTALILNGTPGTPGVSGQPGTPGTNGTVVNPVRLCPGVQVYPSTFIEVAFMINGKLYAVYSANGGFMTELPPGAYSSNAIGSSCSFVINPDLSISN